MALREIRILGDDILRKKSREVTKIDEKILELIKDMKDTMIEYDGVGIAAPQVGVLKRIVIVMNGKKIVTLINPKIVEKEGEAIDVEGCLQAVFVEQLNQSGILQNTVVKAEGNCLFLSVPHSILLRFL